MGDACARTVSTCSPASVIVASSPCDASGPQDKAMLAEGLRNASPQSVHQRFLGPEAALHQRASCAT